MSGFNIIGSYSGIDQAMIDKLMEAHKMPLVGLANKKTSITDKQNAWKDINTRLNSLFEKLKTLEKASTFTSKAATSSNDKMVGVSVGSAAPTGRYDIKVNQLATSSRIIGGGIPETSFEDGELALEGYFNIHDDRGNIVKIDINEDMKNANDVVKGINKAIEEANKKIVEDNKDLPAGEKKELVKINATAIDGKIVLTNEETGKREIKLTGDNKLTLTKLGLNQAARKNEAGEDAEFNINGVDVNSKSNTVSNVIEGMTLSLHRAHDKDNPRDYETIIVNDDIEKASKAVKEFVDQYNSNMLFLEGLTEAGDPETPGSRGKLAGESAVVRLQSRLRTLVTNTITRDKDAINDISQLGVATKDRSGELHFDSAQFTKMMKENPNAVITFFMGTGEKDASEKTIENGYVAKLNSEIDGYISTKKDEHGRLGIIKSTMESYDKTIKDINKQIERFNARMEKKEAHYIKVFSALDVAMMKAESQMGWLQGQVDAMNNVRR